MATTPTGLAAYGGRYNVTGSTLDLAAGTPTQVPLAATMPALGATYPTANEITIADAGDYEINYSALVSTTGGQSLTLAVRVNDTADPSATQTVALTGGVETPLSGSVIVTLAPGDVIDLALTSPSAADVTFGTGQTAALTVKKLDAPAAV